MLTNLLSFIGKQDEDPSQMAAKGIEWLWQWQRERKLYHHSFIDWLMLRFL